MTRKIEFVLPWPPSVNHYWFVLRKGKMAGQPIIGDEGKAYRKAVAECVREQRIPRLTGKLAVTMVANEPNRIRRDIDNLPKAVLDSLKKAGVYEDDFDIDDLHITRGRIVPKGELRITITEIPGAATSSGDLFSNGAAA